MKKLTALLLVLCLVFALAACGKGGTEASTTATEAENVKTEDEIFEEKIRVAALADGSGMSYVKLKNDKPMNYEVTFYKNANDIVNLVKNGEADIFNLPLDKAAALYNETDGGIKILTVSAMCAIHLIDKTGKYKDFSDLRGAKLFAAGKGTQDEYLLDYIFEKNGLDIDKDVTIEWKDSYDELSQMASEGSEDYIILPEPYASEAVAANDDYRNIALFKGESVAYECTAVRTEFLESYPEKVDDFMMYGEIAVNYVNNGNLPAFSLMESNKIFTSQELASESYTRCKAVFTEGEELVTAADAAYDILYKANPDCLGGKIPDSGIYYTAD